MKTSFTSNREKGSALITTVIVMLIMVLLGGSILKYSLSEKRANIRNLMMLRARAAAEDLSVYAGGQVSTKLLRTRSATVMPYTGKNAIHKPGTDISVETSLIHPMVDIDSLDVHAGLTVANPLTAVNDPTNANNGLFVRSNIVKIITRATASAAAVGSSTSYVQQDLQLALIPLFQFAIFYNMTLEFGPGANMAISGPVHTNGDLNARSQTNVNNFVQFTGRVSAAKGFYANTAKKGPTYHNTGGKDSGPGGNGELRFQKPNGTVTTIYSSKTGWRDHLMGEETETPATQEAFMTFATKAYEGNLRTSAHGVRPISPPGVTAPEPDATAPEIAQFLADTRPVTIGPPVATDSGLIRLSKLSWRAGLYIVVNPTSQTRNGILPGLTPVSMPPFSYRCWLNSVTAGGVHTVTEVVMPGQPSYGTDNGTKNDLPNRFTERTAIISNQILRIPASGRDADKAVRPAGSVNIHVRAATDETSVTGYKNGSPSKLSNSSAALSDAYFYDLRRADNSLGFPTNRSTANPFAPRPIAKIDFDWTRFRLMVERTVENRTASTTVYWPNQVKNWGSVLQNVAPLNDEAAQWNAFIFNRNATPTSYHLGLNYPTGTTFSTFPVKGTDGAIYTADPFKLYYTTGTAVSSSDLAGSATSPWYDGITIYIHSVDAETITQTAGVRNRIDSGVRLWNGRGPLASLLNGSYPQCTGSNFCTNDAVYIVGHYNADGSINSTSSATGFGGYSATCPDSDSETLTVVQADAITVLSQPVFTASSGKYYQTSGWSDAFSGHATDSYSTNWATSDPSGTNSRDGIGTMTAPAVMPNVQTPTVTGTPMRTEKLDPSPTEVSSCLLTGIVETGVQTCAGQYPANTGEQTSGGVHNFPRLLESWSLGSSSVGLYIRGSMVAMFTSAVAPEPWSLRVYDAPGRFWGFHTQLAQPEHDVPLEPIMAVTNRLRYRRISEAEYESVRTEISKLGTAK